MRVLNKQQNRDFVILNLTDTQLIKHDFNTDESKVKQIMTGTVKELVERTKPDLITHTGDLSNGRDMSVYEFYADFMDSFDIPWAFVWGNHDNENGADAINKYTEAFCNHSRCLFEKGDPAMGSGNYVIGICEDGVPIEALIMMDSHDRVPYGSDNSWAKLTPNQIKWYSNKISELKTAGYKESIVFTHIPIYAYNDAYKAAAKDIEHNIGVWESYGTSVWNSGYEDSFGVKFEKISSYADDDGVFDEFIRLDHTKNIIVGHDHVNSFSIKYKGVRLTFGLKTGNGCYWNEQLNGGTVIKVGHNGICDIYHEYVDFHDVLKKYEG